MGARRKDVLVPLANHPLAVYMLGLCALSGTVGLLSATPASGMPAWVSWLWDGLLVVGGGVGLAGAAWRDAVTGLLIERSAMLPLGTGAYLYAIPVGYSTGLLAAVAVVAFGVAAHWRAVQITRQIRGPT
jgi:hypothetical protein